MKKISKVLAKLKAKIDFRKRFVTWETTGGLYIAGAAILMFVHPELLKAIIVFGLVLIGLRMVMVNREK